MDFKEALFSIEKCSELAEREDILKAINKRLADMSRNEAKTTRTEALINQLLADMGVEGEDIETKVHSAMTKAKKLREELSEAYESATVSNNKIKQLERLNLVSAAATKANAVPEVLEQLLGKTSEELTIDGDTVKIGDKALKEYAESNTAWKPFLPALFPSNTAAPQLPSGAANGGTPSVDPVENYLKTFYTIPDYLKANNYG